ncbi:MAG: hypothetical protein J7L54_05050, partial [Elusimicrobia bacterium]|nr:hypothetical protein [Elusimicrobiota bacterium]
QGISLVKRLTWTMAVFWFIALFLPVFAPCDPLDFEYRVFQKIIPPNGDGNNDRFFVFYNDNEDLGVSGSIYNVLGMKIAGFKNVGGMASKTYSDPDGANWEGYLYWDPSPDISPGIYIWIVESGGTVRTGTVVVAK